MRINDGNNKRVTAKKKIERRNSEEALPSREMKSEMKWDAATVRAALAEISSLDDSVREAVRQEVSWRESERGGE